jgi:hypothetical protein
MSYEIEIAKIDVHKGTLEVAGEGFPAQTFTFKDEDEWFDVEDYEGKPVILVNIWWDEQWGVQYTESTGDTGNYRNPEIILFQNNDKTGYLDLDWTPQPLQEEGEEHPYDKVERLGLQYHPDSTQVGRYGKLTEDGQTQGIWIYDKGFYVHDETFCITPEILKLIEELRFEGMKREHGTTRTIIK